jgi:hypothetical protein
MESRRMFRTFAALVLLMACAGAKTTPPPPGPPDTTGMSAMTSQMQDAMESMRAGLPGSKLAKLEYRKGDAWVAMTTTPAQISSGMGAGTVVKMMVGLGKPKETFTMPGGASDLVLDDREPHFRYTGEKSDAMTLQIAVFSVAGEQRVTSVDPTKQFHFFKKGVDFKVEKVGEKSWELTPSHPLDPGQYGIANSIMGPVADFAIAPN